MEAILEVAWEPAMPFPAGGDIRPTQNVPAVRLKEGARIASPHLWGFLPPNAPSRKFVSDYFTFNARADKIATSRLYGKPFREARCLVAVSVWYEWPKPPGAKKGIPCTIEPAQEKIFTFGGVWGPWTDPVNGEAHDTATIITTDPNQTIADLPHHRMPVILPPSAWAEWLNPETPVGILQDMLHPTPDEWLDVAVGGPTAFRT